MPIREPLESRSVSPPTPSRRVLPPGRPPRPVEPVSGEALERARRVAHIWACGTIRAAGAGAEGNTGNTGSGAPMQAVPEGAVEGPCRLLAA